MENKNLKLIISFLLFLNLFLLILLGIILFSSQNSSNQSLPIACTLDAKLCLDGSSVGRNPNNNCEFDKCPNEKTICSEELKQCPNGLSVGRNPNNRCEFFECPNDKNDDLVCTMDVKICPDGSYVSRDAKNNCEFFSCP